MQKWDQTLCEKDSDGDGKSNGQELGDPECQWSAEDGECELYNIVTIVWPIGRICVYRQKLHWLLTTYC